MKPEATRPSTKSNVALRSLERYPGTKIARGANITWGKETTVPVGSANDSLVLAGGCHRLVRLEECAHPLNGPGLQLRRLLPGIDRHLGVRRQRRDIHGGLVRVRGGVVRQDQDRHLAVAREVWISSNAPLGYAGVLCFTSEGKLIGRIRLPEVCANLAFGGPNRDRLFMTASQSLYALQVNSQGAAPG